MKFSRIRIFLGAVTLALVSVINVRGDTVSFSNVVALQNGGATRVDLSSNPNAKLLGPQVSFLVDINGATPASLINTLRLTFVETGQLPEIQSFRVPIFDGVPPDYSQLFSFQAQNPSFQGTRVFLTIDLINNLSGAIVQTQTYSFSVATPVPEPATVSLLALGLLGLAARRRRR